MTRAPSIFSASTVVEAPEDGRYGQSARSIVDSPMHRVTRAAQLRHPRPGRVTAEHRQTKCVHRGENRQGRARMHSGLANREHPGKVESPRFKTKRVFQTERWRSDDFPRALRDSPSCPSTEPISIGVWRQDVVRTLLTRIASGVPVLCHLKARNRMHHGQNETISGARRNRWIGSRASRNHHRHPVPVAGSHACPRRCCAEDSSGAQTVDSIERARSWRRGGR